MDVLQITDKAQKNIYVNLGKDVDKMCKWRW